MSLDLQAISSMFSLSAGFRRPDWEQIHDWVAANSTEATRAEVWNAFLPIWLEYLREDLGGDYAVHEVSETFLLTDLARPAARRLQKFATEAICLMREAWTGVAWEGSREKVVILLFSEEDDYYQYISQYYPEGDCPSSSGVWLSTGYTHIAAQLHGEVEAAVTILHELCHDAFGHLTLPRWLDEAIARTLERRIAPRAPAVGEFESDALWGDMSGWSSPIIWAELAELHFSFWNNENIQDFWIGYSFDVGGDSTGLSYSLAEILLKLLLEKSDKQSFIKFLEAAGKHNDAGVRAAKEALGLDLAEIAGTFLGAGDWAPDVKRIADLTMPTSVVTDAPTANDPSKDSGAIANFFAPNSGQQTLDLFQGSDLRKIQHGVNRLPLLDEQTARRELEEQGYAVFVLPSPITDKHTFFEAVRATLPLDPPLHGHDNWDALSDSLGEGLLDHSGNPIAIIWPRADEMSAAAASEFQTALEVLSDVAEKVADPQSTCRKPKTLTIIVDAF